MLEWHIDEKGQHYADGTVNRYWIRMDQNEPRFVIYCGGFPIGNASTLAGAKDYAAIHNARD